MPYDDYIHYFTSDERARKSVSYLYYFFIQPASQEKEIAAEDEQVFLEKELVWNISRYNWTFYNFVNETDVVAAVDML